MKNKPYKAYVRASACPQHSDDTQFKTDVIALIPHLRAFSRSLCSNKMISDDMAQTALAKAWSARANFEAGTNLKAWLFTILRNEISTHHRRAWRQISWNEDAGGRIPAISDQQEWSAELSDVARAMRRLPDAQREALVLVGAGGVSYEDAAKICDTEVGTVKSRVARARVALMKMLEETEGQSSGVRPPTGGAMTDILGQLGSLTASYAQRRSPVMALAA